jgi:hypothetical protein
MIKIDFEFQTEHGVYRDALYLAEDHTLTDAEIDALKQERVDNWIAAITTPTEPEPEPDYIEIDGIKYVKAA